MAPASSLTGVQVENVTFPPEATPPGSAKSLFLGGAGVRGLEIGGNFVKFTAIGVYLEDAAVPSLAAKWSGRSADELMDSIEFFRDVVTGPFQKLTNVSLILPLMGQQYAEKVAENCVAAWKSMGIYSDEEAKAIEKFFEIFNNQTFPSGSSILFTHLPPKTLMVSFSKDGSIPVEGTATIENKLLCEAVLESIIGKNGVSPSARLSLATRLSQLLMAKGLEVSDIDEFSTISNENRRKFSVAPASQLTGVQVENIKFPPETKPPGSAKTLLLGGAGVRGLEIGGNFVKFTAIGVYLEDTAVPSLAVKWSGKTADELMDSVEFFRDIVTGPFQKFTSVSLILPLTGQQYAEKVAENCVAAWKSMGIYSDEEAKAIEKFVEVFKNETFPPGSSILFTHLPPKSLTISFSTDGSIPEEGTATIENKLLSEAVLESIIGKHGVSPSARLSLATRLSRLLIETNRYDISKNRESEKLLEANVTGEGKLCCQAKTCKK